MTWIYLFIVLLITIVFHEFGHLIASLLSGVKVEAFSVGFGKPYLHKKIKGIDFRLSPIPLGGYTKLAGEFDTIPNGFLAQRYLKKVFILLAGIIMNFFLVLVCYWLNYKSIKIGIIVDYEIVKSIFTHDYSMFFSLISLYRPNLFLLQLSLFSLSCGIFNLLPIPSLDGGYLWLVLLEKKVKNFSQFLKKICKIGFIALMLLQLLIVIYIFVL